MRTSTALAYGLWLVLFGVIAYVTALVVASQVFGISMVCLFDDTTQAADRYGTGVALALFVVLLALVVAGPALARRSGTALALVPLAVYGAVIIAVGIAAAVVGDQPCVEDGLFLGE